MIKENKFEYYLKFWGGGENIAKRELGLDTTDFWFDTETERNKFKKQFSKFKDHGIAFGEYDGYLTRHRTIVEITCLHNDNEYEIEYDFGYGYPKESAEYMFFEGNYSCDCNLSSFIREKYPNFPKLECGESISYGKFAVNIVHG